MNLVNVYMCSSYYFFHVPVIWKFKNKKLEAWDFPGGPVVKNPPANTQDMGFIPGPGRSHMAKSKEPMYHNYWAHTLEPTGCNSWACRPQYWSLCAPESRCHNRRSHVSEKPCTVTKSSPCLPQLEKAWKQQWGTSTGKKKQKRLKPESLGISPAWLCQLGKLLNLLD